MLACHRHTPGRACARSHSAADAGWQATRTARRSEELAIAERILDAVAGLGPVFLHVAVFFLAFAECALFLDLVVPGEAGMIVAGAAAARADVPLPTMIAAAAAGAILGDSVSYLIGRRWGMALIRRWEPIRRRLEPRVERAQEFFADRGGAAVFLGRFVGVVRGVVPVVAGTARMPYRRFLPWNIAASLVWTGAVLSAGYLIGRHVEAVVSRASLAVTGVVVVGVAIWWVVSRRRHRAAEKDR
jgi:membrane protein DedA with SNARE-associated domain